MMRANFLKNVVDQIVGHNRVPVGTAKARETGALNGFKKKQPPFSMKGRPPPRERDGNGESFSLLGPAGTQMAPYRHGPRGIVKKKKKTNIEINGTGWPPATRGLELS